MTRTPTADLVTRTLQAVADAVPVADRAAPDRRIVAPADGVVGADGDGVDRQPRAEHELGNRRGDRRAARGGDPHRRDARVAPVAAWPALGGSGARCGRGARGRGGRGPGGRRRGRRRAGHRPVRSGVRAVRARLAARRRDDRGRPRRPGVRQRVGLDGALLGSPDGSGDVLVAVLERYDGQAITEQQVREVRNAVDTPTARLEDSGAEGSDGSRGWVAVSRGSATRDDALAAGAALMDDAAWGDVLPGWTPRPVALGWLPGFAPTYRTRYAGDDRSVDVLTVVGDLPEADVLRTLLVDARTVTVRGQQGWISSLPSASSEMLLWQEAPGLVGAVIADGLSSDELVQVADELRVAEQPAGDADVEVVAEGDVAGMAYRIERRNTGSEGRCVTLYVDGVRHGPLCGLDDPDVPFAQIGPVDRNEDVTLVWGVVAASAREATVGPTATVRARALPLDPDDPASLRYVLLALPHQSSPVDITLSDADGHALSVTTVDLQATIGG